MEEWALVYHVHWLVWVPLCLYEEIVELLMAVIGLIGAGVGVAYLCGIMAPPVGQSMPAWLLPLEILFAAWLAWNGLRGAWAAILALFTPGLVYEGPLDRVTTQHVGGTHGGYRAWVLTAGDQSWEIGKAFNEALALRIEGKHVQLHYRRGTHEITRLLARPAEPRQRRTPSPS